MENYKKVKIIQVGPHFFYDKCMAINYNPVFPNKNTIEFLEPLPIENQGVISCKEYNYEALGSGGVIMGKCFTKGILNNYIMDEYIHIAIEYEKNIEFENILYLKPSIFFNTTGEYWMIPSFPIALNIKTNIIKKYDFFISEESVENKVFSVTVTFLNYFLSKYTDLLNSNYLIENYTTCADNRHSFTITNNDLKFNFAIKNESFVEIAKYIDF